MEFFQVKTLEEANTLMCETFGGYALETEHIDISDATGRVLAQDVFAQVDVPHFDRSVVDGYAVLTVDVQGAGESVPAFLKLIGASRMGEENTAVLHENECMYVPTGGMVPAGTQAMVMIEHTQEVSPDEIAVYTSASMYQHMLRVGDDIRKGEKVLPRGRRLRAQDIGALASIGCDRVSVYRKPRFAVLSTGDEISPPDSAPVPGRINDINTFTISAQIEDFGGEVSEKSVIADDYDAIRSGISAALEISDVALISGGSSVGDKDYTYAILKELSGDKILTHGLNVKPGKPTIVADVGGKPAIGLPGQPASAMVVLAQMLRALHEVFYQTKKIRPYVMAKIDQNVASAPGRHTFQTVQLTNDEDGMMAKVVRGKSGMISLLSSAYGYIEIDENSEGVNAGETVKVYPLQ